MNRTFLAISVVVIILLFALCLSSYAANEAGGKAATTPVETKDIKSKVSSTNDSPAKAKRSSGAAHVLKGIAGTSSDIASGSVGGGASLSPLLSESFQTDLATGSATANIPIVVPPGRKNMQPSLAFSYSSNNSNGVCGVGWGLTTSSIQRSTKKGIPKYDNTDTFVFTSSGSSGDLVLIDPTAGEYRQKIETGFMKYVFDGTNSKWIVRDKTGTKYTFGSSVASRIINSDGTKTFAWLLDSVEDVYRNTVTFTYEKDGGQIYISKAAYTANASAVPPLTADKEICFFYEPGRPDIIYNNRAGWDIQTARRLKDIQIKADGALVWMYMLDYRQSPDTKRSILTQVELFDASGNSLPPKKFTYQTIE